MKLILVLLSELKFEYDILSLVKAFYKEYEVRVIHKDEYNDYLTKEDVPNKLEAIVNVEFNDDSISVSAVDYQNDNKDIYVGKRNIDNDRKSDKNLLKKTIYKVLSNKLNINLPWGTLTGIRPTKIVMGLVESGMSQEEIISNMKDTYYISDERLEMSLDIVSKERELLKKINKVDGYSLYIGIPFCPTTCMYCSFTSYPIKRYEGKVRAYLDALFLEIDYVSSVHGRDKVDTIYIGGGTPTTLDENQLELLLNKISKSFDISRLYEFTVEAGRPDSITREKLEVMKKYGVKRISINPQTMNQKTLDIIGRGHSVEKVIESYKIAREIGFDNINMDIILGLPGEGIAEVKYTLDEIIKLDPDSLTVHSLALKRASRMYEWIEKNGQVDINNTDDIVEITREASKKLNMIPYYLYRQKNMAGNFENIGYSKDDKYGLYNIIIMEEVQNIIALGAGSVSKLVAEDGSVKRCDCAKDVDLYINNISEMIERKKKLYCR